MKSVSPWTPGSAFHVGLDAFGIGSSSVGCRCCGQVRWTSQLVQGAQKPHSKGLHQMAVEQNAVAGNQRLGEVSRQLEE